MVKLSASLTSLIVTFTALRLASRSRRYARLEDVDMRVRVTVPLSLAFSE